MPPRTAAVNAFDAEQEAGVLAGGADLHHVERRGGASGHQAADEEGDLHDARGVHPIGAEVSRSCATAPDAAPEAGTTHEGVEREHHGEAATMMTRSTSVTW